MLKLLRRLFGANDRPAPEPIDPTMKFLIVGLGNPGPKYENTRHNIGFRVLEHLSEDFKPCSHGQMARIKHRGKQVLLLKPDTFMNLSGKAVRYWLQAEKIPKENLLVIVDDLHLDFADLRLRGKGFLTRATTASNPSTNSPAATTTPASGVASAVIFTPANKLITSWESGMPPNVKASRN